MNSTRKIAFLILVILFISFSCDKKKSQIELKDGIWRGEITAQGNQISFNFTVSNKNGSTKISLINGGEALDINEVKVFGDSVIFNMHIFDATIKAKIEGGYLNGSYSKNFADGYILPFHAVFGKKDRFDNVSSSDKFNGKWETIFTDKDGKKSSGIGVFSNSNNILKGTFLKTTGDYRFLEGYTEKDTMHLFTFDGDHIFKFKAVKQNDSILKGEYWSGKTGYYTFISRKNENAKLPNANELTFLKKGFNKVDFSFPNLDGINISPSDVKYQNKVLILQILGTWCPNCMDETKFFAEWYRNNKSKDVEIIGLAYEVKPNFEYAKKRVESMKEKLNVEYDFVIAGTSTTKSASESLPMLNKVISFPTSIIIDKKGNVRRIHTGFSGPATGKYYEDFVQEFNLFIQKLLKE